MESLKHGIHSKSGIYLITNIKSNKKYVGSSYNIYTRIARHKSDLLKNKHANQHLQNSFNKHGLKTFKVNILEFCEKDMLVEKEQHYIDTLKPEFNNIIDVIRKTLSVESRQKISKSLLEAYKNGTKVPSPQRINFKAVDQYDLDGNYINTYESLACAAKIMNLAGSLTEITSPSIGLSCRSNKNTAAGYKWQYKGEPFDYMYKNFLTVVDIEEDVIYEFSSFINAENELGFPRNIIARTLSLYGQGFLYKRRYRFYSTIPKNGRKRKEKQR
jgi:group I intron endonuclease